MSLCATDPDRVVTGMSSGELIASDSASLKEVATFSAHDSPVGSVCISVRGEGEGDSRLYHGSLGAQEDLVWSCSWSGGLVATDTRMRGQKAAGHVDCKAYAMDVEEGGYRAVVALSNSRFGVFDKRRLGSCAVRALFVLTSRCDGAVVMGGSWVLHSRLLCNSAQPGGPPLHITIPRVADGELG